MLPSEQEIALRHRQRRRGSQVSARRQRTPRTSAGSTSIARRRRVRHHVALAQARACCARPRRAFLQAQARAARRRPARRPTRTSRRAARARRANIGRYSTGSASGSTHSGRPSPRRRSCPPFSTSSGFTPKKAGFHSTRSASLPASMEPTTMGDAVRDGGIDGVLGDVAFDARVVVSRGSPAPAAPRWTFILCAVCQVRRMTSPTRPIACESDEIMLIAPRSCRMSSAAIVSAGCATRRRPGPRECPG